MLALGESPVPDWSFRSSEGRRFRSSGRSRVGLGGRGCESRLSSEVRAQRARIPREISIWLI